jgi:P-type conjugative transfer protein TrbJ
MRIIITIFLLVTVGVTEAKAILATEATQILNNIQLVLTAARELQSLVNQATMIQNQIIELNSVSTYQPNTWNDVNSNRATLFNLTNQGVSVSTQIQGLLTQMQQIAVTLNNTQGLSDQDDALRQQTLGVINITIGRINQSRQSYQTQENATQSLLAQNNAAVGQTQALQTLNQIQAQNLTQMQATQEALNNIASLEAAKMTQDNEEKQAEETQLNAEIHPIVNETSGFDFGQSE